MAETVTRGEFDELCADVADIKNTLNNRVLSTLAAQDETLRSHSKMSHSHGESLDAIEERLGGLESELHHVKDGVDALKDHLGR